MIYKCTVCAIENKCQDLHAEISCMTKMKEQRQDTTKQMRMIGINSFKRCWA